MILLLTCIYSVCDADEHLREIFFARDVHRFRLLCSVTMCQQGGVLKIKCLDITVCSSVAMPSIASLVQCITLKMKTSTEWSRCGGVYFNSISPRGIMI